ncbi:hypothetical protein D3OALGA1CA_4753 [Olavius algarvensis associated proteobacterium Delta 3]|nr:hypothetical protein D3OALGB2SA_2027 [Olavius algarvensis associated proteobacterium Delta 3]CAB5156360.1 hypothetical protein D3OALGA1CA_4753 [Olavius algarvensis associated proteobacterium Delta 3]
MKRDDAAPYAEKKYLHQRTHLFNSLMLQSHDAKNVNNTGIKL